MRLRPSAIRYYEHLGILPKPERISGKRRYDRTVFDRLAVIQQAREAGLALEDIRTLFFGFHEGTRAEARWRRLAHRKPAELDQLARHIRRMSTLLKRLKANCNCKTLESCGIQSHASVGKALAERYPSAQVGNRVRFGSVVSELN